jgi:hypothetical protein
MRTTAQIHRVSVIERLQVGPFRSALRPVPAGDPQAPVFDTFPVVRESSFCAATFVALASEEADTVFIKKAPNPQPAAYARARFRF